jgi:hypothetical protein
MSSGAPEKDASRSEKNSVSFSQRCPFRKARGARTPESAAGRAWWPRGSPLPHRQLDEQPQSSGSWLDEKSAAGLRSAAGSEARAPRPKPPTLLPRSAQRQEAFQELLQIGRLPRCPLRGDPRWRRPGKGLGRGFRSFKAVHRATGGFPHKLAACFTRRGEAV